jgi:hypothetical protein
MEDTGFFQCAKDNIIQHMYSSRVDYVSDNSAQGTLTHVIRLVNPESWVSRNE